MDNLLHQLKKWQGPMGYWYVATPYTNHPMGCADAFEMACDVTAFLIDNGVKAFSPIVHCHLMDDYITTEDTHPLWMELDKSLLYRSSGLLVVKMKGWLQSKGIKQEIEWAEEWGLPILFMSYDVDRWYGRQKGS